MRPLTVVQVIEEAVALEDAGGVWSQRHAAAITGVSAGFLRNSDCPKRYLEGNGPKGKRLVVYLPEEVRAWYASRIRTRDGEPLARRVG